MNTVTIIGIDLAKRVFHAHGAHADPTDQDRGNHIETPFDRALLMRQASDPTAKTTTIRWRKSIKELWKMA